MMDNRCEVRNMGGLAENGRVKLPRLINQNFYLRSSSTPFQTYFQPTMAFVDSRKRKLAEDGAKVFTKPHKRPRSDHTPIPAIDYQAQLRNGKTGETGDIASATKASSIKAVAKQQQASDKASHSSADPASTVRSAKAGPSKKTAQKQVSSSGISSSDEGDIFIADPVSADADTISNVALVAASISALEEASGEGYESEEEEDGFDEEDDEDEEDEDEEDEDEDEDEEDEAEPKLLDKKIQAQRLKKKAPLEKNSQSSDPESDTSSTGPASHAVHDSNSTTHPSKPKKEPIKADDPHAFASSMSAILTSNLTRTQRLNPILARSADAKEADAALLDRKLEKRARAEMKREKGDKGGWQPDVIFGERVVGADAEGVMGPGAAYQQRERELRKMAQRGVVKMFNAFAHVREKAGEVKEVGGSRAKREERATEMSKEGWLEYVGLGGKGKVEEKGKDDQV